MLVGGTAGVHSALHGDAGLVHIEDECVIGFIAHTQVRRVQSLAVKGHSGNFNDNLLGGGDGAGRSQGNKDEVVLVGDGNSAVKLKGGPVRSINLDVVGLGFVVAAGVTVVDFKFGFILTYAGGEGDAFGS